MIFGPAELPREYWPSIISQLDISQSSGYSVIAVIAEVSLRPGPRTGVQWVSAARALGVGIIIQRGGNGIVGTACCCWRLSWNGSVTTRRSLSDWRNSGRFGASQYSEFGALINCPAGRQVSSNIPSHASVLMTLDNERPKIVLSQNYPFCRAFL